MLEMIKRFTRKGRRKMDEAVQRLRVSKISSSEPVLAFWRDHGRQWALEEASFDDLSRVAEIAERVSGKGDAAAALGVEAELREIWRAGFSDPADAYGWNEMDDKLPAAAFLAFIRGAHEVWRSTEQKI